MSFIEEYIPPLPSTTGCKHAKRKACEKCGTSKTNDYYHTTKGGKGIVGRAIARHKRK